MEEFIYYKALQSYNSSDKYMLNIQKDDVLKTESPFSKSNVHPRGWLHAYNERTKEQGYVPVEKVELLGSHENKTYHHPLAVGLEQSHTVHKIPTDAETSNLGHNLVEVYFVTPILCPHCCDYIWGQGKIGSQCIGENLINTEVISRKK